MPGRVDLRTQIRRRVQQEPIFVIDGHRQRGLSPRLGLGITRPRPPTGRHVRVPLWEAATRRRAEHDDTHGRLLGVRRGGDSCYILVAITVYYHVRGQERVSILELFQNWR